MSETSTSGTITKIDLIKFATDVMSEVESVRSYLPAFNDEIQAADQRPVESRVNAFFRLIGLPMFVSITPYNDKGKSSSQKSHMVLTPGYWKGGSPAGIIENSDGITLSGPNGVSKSAKDLLETREQLLIEREQSIGTPDMNLRMETAFNSPLGLVLDKVDIDRIGSTLFKMVSPFAVSYMSIFPGSNELSKPFLFNPELGRPPPTSTPIRRPFIETVIRIRMVSLDGGNQEQVDYLANTRTRVAQLSPEAANMLPKQASSMEAFIIDQMLGSIDQFADKWVALRTRWERLSKQVSIVLRPKSVSSQRSPFGKRGNVSTELYISDYSETGQRLANLNRGIAVSEAMLGLLPTDDLTSLTGAKTKNVTPNALTTPFISVLRQPLEQQRKKLDEVNSIIANRTQQADRLRLEQEMMTGEFTGLSLPDVAFTLLGLFLIEREDLIAMLDSKVQDQMLFDTVLGPTVNLYIGGSSADVAVANLQNKVRELYNTLGKAIEWRINRDKRTGKNSVPVVGAQSPDGVEASDLRNQELESASE